MTTERRLRTRRWRLIFSRPAGVGSARNRRSARPNQHITPAPESGGRDPHRSAKRPLRRRASREADVPNDGSGAYLVTVDTATLHAWSRRLLAVCASPLRTERTIARLKGGTAATSPRATAALASTPRTGRRVGPTAIDARIPGRVEGKIPVPHELVPHGSSSKVGRRRPAGRARGGSPSCRRAPFSRPLWHRLLTRSAFEQVKHDKSRVELGVWSLRT
jgi:hypothetical protein